MSDAYVSTSRYWYRIARIDLYAGRFFLAMHAQWMAAHAFERECRS